MGEAKKTVSHSRIDFCIVFIPLDHANLHLIPLSLSATLAASRPGAPMTPPPGCAPLPHRYRPRTGVSGLKEEQATGRERKSWSSDMAPWKMLPPVSPKVSSRAGGQSTSRPTTLDLKPGAYLEEGEGIIFLSIGDKLSSHFSTVSNMICAYCSFASSSHSLPPLSL